MADGMNLRIETSPDGPAIRELAERIRGLRDRTLAEVARVVVGMDNVAHQFLIALVRSEERRVGKECRL